MDAKAKNKDLITVIIQNKQAYTLLEDGDEETEECVCIECIEAEEKAAAAMASSNKKKRGFAEFDAYSEDGDDESSIQGQGSKKKVMTFKHLDSSDTSFEHDDHATGGLDGANTDIEEEAAETKGAETRTWKYGQEEFDAKGNVKVAATNHQGEESFESTTEELLEIKRAQIDRAGDAVADVRPLFFPLLSHLTNIPPRPS